MSAKRKSQDGGGAETSQLRDRKKAKIQESRQIAIQAPTHVEDGTCPIAWITVGPTPPKAVSSFPHP